MIKNTSNNYISIDYCICRPAILQTFDRKAECADMGVSLYAAAKEFVEFCVIQI